jgi:hypothetical protein
LTFDVPHSLRVAVVQVREVRKIREIVVVVVIVVTTDKVTFQT